MSYKNGLLFVNFGEVGDNGELESETWKDGQYAQRAYKDLWNGRLNLSLGGNNVSKLVAKYLFKNIGFDVTVSPKRDKAASEVYGIEARIASKTPFLN